MAKDIPPRANSMSQTIKRSRDAREVLISMGFPKKRAEKALAATGGQDVQVAADWLLAHAFDPELDKSVPREFIVYAIPLGKLGEQIDEFFESCVTDNIRNPAQRLFPHVTLCNFFKVPDEKVFKMGHILHKCVEAAMPTAPKQIKLKRFSASNYIGLFLEDDVAKWFKQMMNYFESEMQKEKISIEALRRQLHLSLAHQFNKSQQDKIEEKLYNHINPDTPAIWEIHLYSRDSTKTDFELHKVVYPFTGRSEDELDLKEGDYIYVSSGDSSKTDSDGWIMGSSFMTSQSGVFPANYVERAKDSDIYTLHRIWPITQHKADTGVVHPPKQNSKAAVSNSFPEAPKYEGAVGLFSKDELKKEEKIDEHVYTKINKLPTAKQPEGPRKFFVFRHSERVDVTFGKQWIELSFDQQGIYHRRNLNMPHEVPRRVPAEFTKDSPITEIGLYQAKLTGMGLKQQGISIQHVYCSPALRCVQTADAILDGLQADHTVTLKLENGLYEWLAWCHGEMPKFMSVEDLYLFGMRVDKHYKPKVQLGEMNMKETSSEFYKRMYNITRILLKESAKGNVMFVGHAASLEAATRQLVGHKPRPAQEFVKIVQKVPYCGLSMAQETTGGGWELADPPIPPLTHGPNVRFDWRILNGVKD